MNSRTNLSRRQFLSHAAVGAVATTFPFGKLSLAQVKGDKRLVIVIARGGMDGLALLPPYGDPNYQKRRGRLALTTDVKNTILHLNKLFGLHPAALQLLPFWARKEMAILPAVATNYTGSLHSDASTHLESGLSNPNDPNSGWLNRAVRILNRPGTTAVSTSQDTPSILSGPIDAGRIQSAGFEPVHGLHKRLSMLYQDDPLLATAFLQENAIRENLDAGLSEDDRNADKDAPHVTSFPVLAERAAASLREADGARIAVIETSGWDTHQNQGALEGLLARRFSSLAGGLQNLAASLGDAWKDTAVLVISEFGRSISPNNQLGTDHGRATPMIVLGGSVKGGMRGKWPGLGKDPKAQNLTPTEDIRALFKAVLIEHMGISPTLVDRRILPGSASILPITGIF